MSSVSIIIATLTGREKLLEVTEKAYAETIPDGVEVEWIVAKDKGVAGEAWNAGAAQATGDYLMLACDDMIPLPGWLEAAVEAADEGVLPAPRLLHPDGSLQNCGSLGGGMWLGETADGTESRIAELPFMRRDYWTPDMCLPVHYYSDDWIGFRARQLGLRVEVRRAYCFIHLKGEVGTKQQQGPKMWQDRASYLMAVTRLSEGDGVD